MSEESKMYKGDVGTEILVDCGTDITAATVKKLKVKRPDNSEIEWEASVDKKKYLRYIVQAGDFDSSGKYFLQAYIEMPSGKWSGETASFVIRSAYG